MAKRVERISKPNHGDFGGVVFKLVYDGRDYDHDLMIVRDAREERKSFTIEYFNRYFKDVVDTKQE